MPRVTRITTDPSALWPAVSPDGKMVAYVARRGSQNRGIWVQHIGGGAAVRIAEGCSDGSHIAFSADGSKIYYSSTSDPPGIYEVPVLGGEPRLTIPGAQHIQPSPDSRWKSCLVWPPDGTRLLVALRNVDQPTGGQSVAVSPLDGSKRVSRFALGENLRKRGFTVSSLRLYAWLPDGDIVFSAGYGDAFNIWRIPLEHANEAEPSPVTVAPWHADMGDVRGNHLVFANSRQTGQVWRLPADVNAGRVLGAPQRVTPELIEAQFPDVRRDGSALAYVSRKGGGQGLFLLDLRTGKKRTLVLEGNDAAYSTFSPDGPRVAFMLARRGPGWPAFVVAPNRCLPRTGSRSRAAALYRSGLRTAGPSITHAQRTTIRAT
ncbi:MAG: hypothetical protein LLG20_25245 [Acidobacteriales bacterium]|nr:hypothetical protein [Terriglobales bacterium]